MRILRPRFSQRNAMLGLARTDEPHEAIAQEIMKRGRNGWVEGWAQGWSNWGFGIHDHYPSLNGATPVTLGLLQRMCGIKVAALSLFRPGTLLPMHYHAELAEHWGTFHLGLEMARCGVALRTATDGFIPEAVASGSASTAARRIMPSMHQTPID